MQLQRDTKHFEFKTASRVNTILKRDDNQSATLVGFHEKGRVDEMTGTQLDGWIRKQNELIEIKRLGSI